MAVFLFGFGSGSREMKYLDVLFSKADESCVCRGFRFDEMSSDLKPSKISVFTSLLSNISEFMRLWFERDYDPLCLSAQNRSRFQTGGT